LAALGNTAGKDIAQQKATYPAVFGLERSHEIASELSAKGYCGLSSLRLSAPRDCERLRSSGKSPRVKRLSRSSFLRCTAGKNRTRLDVLMVERGLAPSREKAQAMILFCGREVLINGAQPEKAGQPVAHDCTGGSSQPDAKYVSRGGFKLEGALDYSEVAVAGRVCLGLGNLSNADFTDCLLQRGAARV